MKKGTPLDPVSAAASKLPARKQERTNEIPESFASRLRAKVSNDPVESTNPFEGSEEKVALSRLETREKEHSRDLGAIRERRLVRRAEMAAAEKEANAESFSSKLRKRV